MLEILTRLLASAGLRRQAAREQDEARQASDATLSRCWEDWVTYTGRPILERTFTYVEGSNLGSVWDCELPPVRRVPHSRLELRFRRDCTVPCTLSISKPWPSGNVYITGHVAGREVLCERHPFEALDAGALTAIVDRFVAAALDLKIEEAAPKEEVSRL